ncbi:unnamed protein product [Protopolystoma xenopodis]|uniref:Uncharacterized protein n=1 Tax=Protopolystoma xenopodis TaxID=117903 RepID=A0A448WJB8_9PLAT|nr:unnamed protein product [Protopolystoma xenopodis]
MVWLEDSQVPTKRKRSASSHTLEFRSPASRRTLGCSPFCLCYLAGFQWNRTRGFMSLDRVVNTCRLPCPTE